MAVKSTFSAGKCTKKAGKWFTSPQNTDEEYRWEQYSRGPADNGSADNANHIKTRDGKKRTPNGELASGRPGKKEKGMLKRKRVS